MLYASCRRMDPTNGVPSFFEKDRSMTYKRVAVFDNRGEDLLPHMESCISFIEQVIATHLMSLLRKVRGSRKDIRKEELSLVPTIVLCQVG